MTGSRWAAAIDDTRIVERRERLCEKIREWAGLHGGEPPRVNDFRHVRDSGFVAENGAGWPSYITVIRYSPDGTWDGMIEASGFSPRGRGQPSPGSRLGG